MALVGTIVDIRLVQTKITCHLNLQFFLDGGLKGYLENTMPLFMSVSLILQHWLDPLPLHFQCTAVLFGTTQNARQTVHVSAKYACSRAHNHIVLVLIFTVIIMVRRFTVIDILCCTVGTQILQYSFEIRPQRA